MGGIRFRPSREEFEALASTHTVVPVWAELLADLETPVAAYAKLVGDGPGFLLESVEHGERWSRFSFVGREPSATLVLRNGRVVYEKAVGWSDMEAGRRMTPDALFRIASQTKAITSVAIMALVEEGKIAISDPVSRFIPAYSRTMVATRTDTGVAIVPAKRAITIRDLLTHTAGIS